MANYRVCESLAINTGASQCPFDPNYVEDMILLPIGMGIDITSPNFLTLCHADRPARIMPINGLAEYAKSGGEGQVNKQGYASSSYTGLSELVETWSLARFDEGLKAELLRLNGKPMSVIFIDKDGKFYGQKGSDAKLYGYELSAIFPNVTPFKASGSPAVMSIVMHYKDVEYAWKNTMIVDLSSSDLSELKGLVWVDVVNVSGSNYKIVEHYGNLDLTTSYGSLWVLGAFDGASAVSYANGLITITKSGASEPTLKAPSLLAALASPIKGIEQWS